MSARSASPPRSAARSASPGSPKTVHKTKTVDDAHTGRERLLQLVAEARRFHAHHATPRRPALPASSTDTSQSSGSAEAPPQSDNAVTGGLEPWEYVRRHVEYFWDSDHGSEKARYATCKEWLTSLQLWDTSITWAQVEGAASEAKAQRRKERLAQLKPGRLFN